uniref:Uncharacterized protein n=1 Tax=Arundo donax TaxID=35708 RepID=A0A0A9A9V3_ARUDO
MLMQTQKWYGHGYDSPHAPTHIFMLSSVKFYYNICNREL